MSQMAVAEARKAERSAPLLAEGVLQRQCDKCRKNKPLLQREADGPVPETVPPIVHEGLRSPGRPLDPETRAFIEPRFGHDFSRVRVHADSKAAESARSVNALAYTLGNDIVFDEGRYAPNSKDGSRLLEHELSHVVEQRMSGQPILQRQEAGKKEEKKDAGEVVLEGLKTAAGQAKDNNPKVKQEVIDPLKKRLKSTWQGISTGKKAGLVGFGATTAGLSLGPMLADPKGRKLLEGINLGAPMELIPYMPLTGFKYTLPSGETESKRMFKFETSFKGDDYLKLLVPYTRLPDLSLGVDMQWGYDPVNENLRVLGAQAKVGILPGISLSGGAYSGLLPTPNISMIPEGGMVESKQRIPELPRQPSVPDVRVMFTVDLLKLGRSSFGKKNLPFLQYF